jgi:hypothetical protein
LSSGKRPAHPPAQRPVRAQHLAVLEVRVPAARVRKDENARTLETLSLQSWSHRLTGATMKQHAEQRDANQRNRLRPPPANLPAQNSHLRTGSVRGQGVHYYFDDFVKTGRSSAFPAGDADSLNAARPAGPH